MKQEGLGLVVPVFRDHWITLLPHVSGTLLATGLLTFGILFIEWAVVGLLALFSLFAWGRFSFYFLRWRLRRYVFKDGRLHVLEGFWVQKHQNLQFHFPPVVTEQGLLGRLLNYGSLKVGKQPNDFCIPRLNNFSLVEHLLLGEKSQPPAPAPTPTIVVQPPPVILIVPQPSATPRRLGELPAYLDGASAVRWSSGDFSGPYTPPSSPLDEDVVVPDEPHKSEVEEEEWVFHTSYEPVRTTLRTGPSIFDLFVQLLGRGMKKGGTLLLDYLEALGDGVILAAQWFYRKIRK
jgi:hypothetical protein